jgi:transposase
MRKIREVLRLHYELGLSQRQIAISCQVSRRSIHRHFERFNAHGLTWPLPASLDDATLEQLLYPSASKPNREPPDFGAIHGSLKRRGMTLFLLWEEWRSHENSTLSYSRFCQLYRNFKSTLCPVMRQTHVAGEKCFVDFAGITLSWVDNADGVIHTAEIFVAILGASNYTYVEALPSQQLQDWIMAHVRAFDFFGGTPTIVVPDNLKSGVTQAHHYDPDINLTYQDFANHYGVAIVPARVNAPKDKAKVEAAVKHVEQRILAKLRDHTFFSVGDINAAIKPLLNEVNQAPFQKLPGSRLSEFEALDKPALKSLPTYRYEYAAWKKVRVNIDYHIEVHHHYYSVPHRYCKQEMDCRLTATLVQFFYKHQLIAIHPRVYRKGHSTIKEHMPKSHQEYAQWTPERIIHWAHQSGEKTAKLIQTMIESRPHPQQAYRACLGVLRLGKHYGKARLEKAAHRALALGTYTYQSIASILRHGLDDKPLPAMSTQPHPTVAHEYVRGGEYFH